MLMPPFLSSLPPKFKTSPKPISLHTQNSSKSTQNSSQCKPLDSLSKAKLFHQLHIITTSSLSHPKIVSAYLSSDAPSHALAALLHLPPSPSSVFYWNTLIKDAVVSLRNSLNAIHLFNQMRALSWKPDAYTYPYVLKACSELPSILLGTSVHGLAILSGFESNVFACNAVVAMYGRCGYLDLARQMLDEMCERGVFDVISFNSMTAAYVHSADYKRGLKLFDVMVNKLDHTLRPDVISLVNILPACANLGAWRLGKEIHCYAMRRGLIDDIFVGNALVDMYAKCGLMGEAERIFERMEVKDVVSWNAMVTGHSQIGSFDDALSLFEKMRGEEIELNVVTWSAVIAGYAQRGMGYQALDVFREMMGSGAEPNVVTLVSVLSGCASVGVLRQGVETHCYSLKRIFNVQGNDFGEVMMVVNGLIDMYAKCKSLDIACRMFESIERHDRSVVTWTVMIGGFAQHGNANDALKLFSDMVKNDNAVIPNAFTVACALVACARLGALRYGRQVHAYVLRRRYESSILFVANCLIDMYAKSGDVDSARLVFDSMTGRNVVSWTSLMTGYGTHGRGKEALKVFDGMQSAGLPIDGVTFLVVLYACSHSGMVDRGISYFNSMNTEFGVVPGVEHYACMVDLLGRAGRLDEVMTLINRMPMEPTPVIWVALLGASRTHSNVELGEYAAKKLSELESVNDGTYTLLSNIYANARRWKDVARIRSLMKHTGIKKRPGCSWVQGKTGTAMFFVGDRSHPMAPDIYNLLADLIDRIKVMGYVPETSFALHDVDDEEKGDLLFEHSEKLALAYALLTTAPGLPIRIIKNLRVCGDCHTAITFISKIVPHEIILRDSSRFHHFENGSCSCQGYW